MIIIAYPFAVFAIGMMINLFVFGVSPAIVDIPSIQVGNYPLETSAQRICMTSISGVT